MEAKCLPEFSELSKQLDRTQGGGYGNPEFLVRSAGGRLYFQLQLASEVETIGGRNMGSNTISRLI